MIKMPRTCWFHKKNVNLIKIFESLEESHFFRISNDYETERNVGFAKNVGFKYS